MAKMDEGEETSQERTYSALIWRPKLDHSQPYDIDYWSEAGVCRRHSLRPHNRRVNVSRLNYKLRSHILYVLFEPYHAGVLTTCQLLRSNAALLRDPLRADAVWLPKSLGSHGASASYIQTLNCIRRSGHRLL